MKIIKRFAAVCAPLGVLVVLSGCGGSGGATDPGRASGGSIPIGKVNRGEVGGSVASNTVVTVANSMGLYVSVVPQEDGTILIPANVNGSATMVVSDILGFHPTVELQNIDVGPGSQGSVSINIPPDMPMKSVQFLNPTPLRLAVGQRTQLRVQLARQDGMPTDGIFPSFVVKRRVGEIDEQGYFIARRPGRGSIIAVIDGKSDRINVTVSRGPSR